MAPGKRRLKSPVAESTLSADLLLEIVARSEPVTLVRCAAASKPLRLRILDASFLRRVCTNEDGIIPPRFLVYLHTRSIRNRSHDQKPEPSVSLVHPATPAASSFTDRILAPHMLRLSLDDDRVGYHPLMSRGGLVLLRRSHSVTAIGTSVRRMDERCYDLCVFNPMTGGDRTYLSCRCHWFRTYVLLTAADGIGCSFMLLAANVDRCDQSGGFRITVQATNPGGTSWGPVTTADANGLLPFRPFTPQRDPVILHGGIVHWQLWDVDHVLTYNICTKRLGSLDLPPTNYGGGSQRLLGTSSDGRRLRLLRREGFATVSMWLHISDGGWAKEAVIDVEHKLRSLLDPYIVFMSFEFKCWGERSGAVLLQIAYRPAHHEGSRIVLNLETMEMRRISLPHSSLLLEIDLSARLRAMKIY